MDENAMLNLADEVERYLAVHPTAADTAQGILRWWLPRGHADASADQLKRALDLLVGRGAIVERRMADGRSIYARFP
jgi:hypothetical protein